MRTDCSCCWLVVRCGGCVVGLCALRLSLCLRAEASERRPWSLAAPWPFIVHLHREGDALGCAHECATHACSLFSPLPFLASSPCRHPSLPPFPFPLSSLVSFSAIGAHCGKAATAGFRGRGWRGSSSIHQQPSATQTTRVRTSDRFSQLFSAAHRHARRRHGHCHRHWTAARALTHSPSHSATADTGPIWYDTAHTPSHITTPDEMAE